MSNVSVTSETWLQNFRPYVNGTKVRWPDLYLSLMTGECIDLTLEFEYSYLIGDPESPLKLCCEPDAESLGLVCDPPFGQLVEMKEGLIELTWHICARKTSGAPFELHFEMPFYEGMPSSPPVPGRVVNLITELEVKFDNMSTAFGGQAYGCHGARHLLKVMPVGESLLNERVRLLRTVPAGVEISPAESMPQTLSAAGANWTIDCLRSTEDGEIEVRLEFMDLGFESNSLCFKLGHYLVEAKHWETDYWDSKTYSIRATSVFLGTPAAGVQVRLNGVDYEKTDKYGEAHKTDGEGGWVSLSIKNYYDGSYV
ncbi:hypothetical protein ACTJK3_07250 [Pseudomonas sp. 22105]|uniref:hypothetical protein n=1 Tax=Pseudomonas TaxID=286 RepID=UPI000D25949C|nr:hypothetical protein [Pseudomonas glycinae]AWA41115.1 hypothetical protein DBV33_21855 [Pseudomonas fluorescens]